VPASLSPESATGSLDGSLAADSDNRCQTTLASPRNFRVLLENNPRPSDEACEPAIGVRRPSSAAYEIHSLYWCASYRSAPQRADDA